MFTVENVLKILQLSTALFTWKLLIDKYFFYISELRSLNSENCKFCFIFNYHLISNHINLVIGIYYYMIEAT